MTSSMNQRTVDPTEGPLFRKIMIYALPIMATGLLQLMFNAADLVVVGRFCGSNSVAAVGATGSLTSLLVNFFLGMSVGVGVSSAHALGARNDELTSKTVHTAVPAALIFGLIMSSLGLIFSPTLLELMGTPEDVIGLSATYMRIYFLGMPGSMLCNFGIAILRAAGDTKSPLIYLTLSGVVNVILNVIFVVFFHMDVAGVALATLISGTLSAILVTLTLMRRTDGCRLMLRKIRIYKAQMVKIFTIGVPAGIQSSLFAISNVLIQSSINSFGSAAMAGNSAGASIDGFLSTTLDAFSQTAMNFTGLCVGAHRHDRLNKILSTCLGCIIAFGLPLGLLLYSFSEPLLSIYITDSAEAIHYGTTRMMLMTTLWFLGGIQGAMSGILRGMGRSVIPMVVCILGVCVFRVVWIFTIFQIPQFHTFAWLMGSYPISWFLTFLAQFLCYLKIRRKEEVPAVA